MLGEYVVGAVSDIRESVRKVSDLKVHDGRRSLAITNLNHHGFSVEVDMADRAGANLRGRVNIFDHDRHVSTGLVMLDAVVDGRASYVFKSVTQVRRAPPRDFAEDDRLVTV